MNNDVKILRELAGRYAIAANDDRNYERRLLHKAVNDLHMIRPVVLIDELPWNELNGEGELTLHCEDPFLRTVEQKLRQTLYKWNHFPADMIVTPYFGIDKVIHTTGNGVAIVENTIHADETNHIVSHEFVDQMEDESFLERLHNETISYDKEETERRYNLAANIIGDIIPVKIIGTPWVFDTCWDDIAEWHGVTNLLMDLAMRPEFMHAVASKLTDIYLDKVRQYEELNLFEGFQPYLHSTSAYSDDLPSKEFDGIGFQAKDVWGRGAAQVFSSVSPAMREEFDITYMKKAMAPFGLVYYGCCEPLHNMIDIVEQIPNLRKITVTPWADVDIAAENIGKKYVIAHKPSPSNLAVDQLDEEVVRKELTRAIDACYRNGCSFDMVLKDISTVNYNPQNLVKWEKIAMELVQNYK
ncbi:MAG: hypothetical protein HFJ85_04170 [Oscillospiraceae bacterium]|nr:hypothetical protein [Oscillospiraceae bacterium]